ncbi:hypothetical protein NMG60_11005559 [Bertholletia excelsa]
MKEVEVDLEPDGLEGLTAEVKKGHFAVSAAKGGVSKKFIVEFWCLGDPSFMCLLKQAKGEYGFKQEGPLAVPCHQEELQKSSRRFYLHRRRGCPCLLLLLPFLLYYSPRPSYPFTCCSYHNGNE